MSPRTGRRGKDSGTREAILTAAREQFAQRGYAGATIRGVAAIAGVDPALIHHFFGTKDQLFSAALDMPVVPSQVAEVVARGGPREETGVRMTRFFLSIWGGPDARSTMRALIASAATNDQAATALRQFFASALLGRVAEALGVEALRVEAAVAQLLGVAILRYILAVPPLSQLTDDEVVALIGPMIQRIFDDAAR